MRYISKLFTISCGVILTVTAVAKAISAFGVAKLLLYPDPIFRTQFRYLMLLASLIELLVALICFYPGKNRTAVFLVAYLSTMLFAYRLGLWMMHWSSPCPCLGHLADALHIAPRVSDVAMKIVLAYLLVGSYTVLFYFTGQRKRSVLASGLNK